jgi:molybdopterin molybdotransferase
MSDPIAPPPLRNDCFALPAGVHWTPVAEALALLKERLTTITQHETVDVAQAMGRVLAADVIAPRANPPLPNTAIDGYGFAGGRGEGPHVMPLLAERAAAGPRIDSVVPAGQAVRILTGAALPSGVDTVVLQEDVTASEGKIAFNGPIKAGANTRRAGEDVQAGNAILAAGHRITVADMALIAATGVERITVCKALRVAVISTGGRTGPSRWFRQRRPNLRRQSPDVAVDDCGDGACSDRYGHMRRRSRGVARSVGQCRRPGGCGSDQRRRVGWR